MVKDQTIKQMADSLRALVRQIDISGATDEHGHPIKNLQALEDVRIALSAYESGPAGTRYRAAVHSFDLVMPDDDRTDVYCAELCAEDTVLWRSPYCNSRFRSLRELAAILSHEVITNDLAGMLHAIADALAKEAEDG